MSRPLVRFARPYYDIREAEAVRSVATKDHAGIDKPLTNGGQVISFEERFEEFTGGRAVAVSSCASAIVLYLQALAIGHGDIVIVPALTHVALPNAIELCGATCRFVDAHPDSGNLDPDLIDMRGVRLITTMHYLGQPGYMMSLTAIARKHDVPILEDCALALGSRHSSRHVGLIGSAGCFSFYPAKHITTGEGGIVLTRNAEFAGRLKRLRSFGYGTDRNAGIEEPGLNHRMTEFAGALGVVQILKLPEILMKRRANAARLRTLMKPFRLIGGDYALAADVGSREYRDEVRARMLSAGVETSVYYPMPVPDHPYYRAKYNCPPFPAAESFCYNHVALSVGPHLGPEKMEITARVFKESLAGVTNAHSSHRWRRVHRPSSRTTVAP